MNDTLKNVLKLLTPNISGAILRLGGERERICEIRMRAGLPLCVSTANENLYVTDRGLSCCKIGAVYCTAEDIEQTVSKMCEHSFYAYQHEINRGFITLQGGCRVGIAGTAVETDGKIGSIKNITSLNIRIARQYIGCSDKIMRDYAANGLQNTVIIGAPASGKTTVLRDIAYQLSNGGYFSPKRVCAVDERYELFGTGVSPSFESGAMCDRICGADKQKGILMALQSLNPQIIVFDEMISETELQSCEKGFSAGVTVITSVHAGSVREFAARNIGKKIICGDVFTKFVFLGRCAGEGMTVMTKKELENAIARSDFDKHNTGGSRIYEIGEGGKAM